jgi:hypothetical protein
MSGDLPATNDLLAAAFSSLLKTPVISQSEYDALKQEDPEAAIGAQALNLRHLYEHTYKWGSLGGAGVGAGDGDRIQVFVKTLTGNTKEVFIATSSTIFALKREIEKELQWPAEQQRLIFADQQLENDKTVADYSIGHHATLHIVMMLRGGGNSLYYIDGSLLAPNFDYDFTNKDDGTTKYYRGQFTYTRPCGWQRKAMKVIGQYGDDVWLGGGGIRTATTPGEWPVSYHSAAVSAHGNIAEVGSQLSHGETFNYDRGIFTTPLATVAAQYAPTFEYRGQKYRVLFQNRINPATLQQVNPSAPDSVGEFWASPKEEDVRPYNICLRKVNT